MARISKPTPFSIYEDHGIPTPDSSYHPSFDEELKQKHDDELLSGQRGTIDDGFVTESEDGHDAFGKHGNGHTKHSELDRRTSDFTRTSISSFPESSYPTDNDSPIHKPYYSTSARPYFRRPESIRRMQMASPPPFSRSPRESVLRNSKSRQSTPGSRGSPRPRKKEDGEEGSNDRYPLVLLHITLLPVQLPWSAESVQHVLPAHMLQNLYLLRSKISPQILQRGILIPHPRDDYELLEERLLEALELKMPRIVNGHFRNRQSTDSMTTIHSVGTDSGLGSSDDGSDADFCATCNHGDKSADSATNCGRQKWSIRVFAANGLMRAAAWSAAWSEMERVDVEIVPYIGEKLRQKLDNSRLRKADQGRPMEPDSDETTVPDYSDVLKSEDADATMMIEHPHMVDARLDGEMLEEDYLPSHEASENFAIKAEQRDQASDLPQIYRPSDIPLSILLRNYLYLLAQDRRKMGMLLVGAILMLLTMHIGAARTASSISMIVETDLAAQTMHLPVTAAANMDVLEAMADHGDGLVDNPTVTSVETDLLTNASSHSPEPVSHFDLDQADSMVQPSKDIPHEKPEKQYQEPGVVREGSEMDGLCLNHRIVEGLQEMCPRY